MQTSEQTGDKFNLTTYFNARTLCQDVVKRIAMQVTAGLSEKDGQELIKNEFKKEGVTKFWHPSKFRIGSETVKSFRELADESVRLGKGDIYFVDVGPIIEEHEADYGETFVLPANDVNKSELRTLADASLKIWQHTADKWKNAQLSGVDLYHVANNFAQSLGYYLNPLMAGHRLGDFPHALYSKDRLFSVDLVPTENLWVLEIHIVSDSHRRGAFFEDILHKGSNFKSPKIHAF